MDCGEITGKVKSSMQFSTVLFTLFLYVFFLLLFLSVCRIVYLPFVSHVVGCSLVAFFWYFHLCGLFFLTVSAPLATLPPSEFASRLFRFFFGVWHVVQLGVGLAFSFFSFLNCLRFFMRFQFRLPAFSCLSFRLFYRPFCR